MGDVNAAAIIRTTRRRAGLSLRALARRAGTSHATLAAYEAGRKVPSVETLDRIVRSAGYELEVGVAPSVHAADGPDRAARGRELAEVLELAAQFPARHSATLDYPVFGAAGRS
jgi:transcriptional regulator with XRE-family HTH domain